MRRALIILVVLAVLIGGSFVIYRYTSQAKEPPAPDYETIAVEEGNLISTVSATGSIEPEDEVALLFRGASRVAEVLVKEGDQVTADEVLARLDTTDISLAMAQAETNLAISQAQLEKLKTPPADVEIAAAQAAVTSAEAAAASARVALESAQASYNDLVSGPTADEQQAAQATLERARIVRDQAQAAYDQVANQPNIAMLPQSAQLQQATVDYETAAANYRITTAKPKASQLAAARAQIEQAKASVAQADASLANAQSSLDRLQRGPEEQDLAIAEAQVRQSELAIAQSRLNETNSELVSPISGVATSVNVGIGELPPTGQPAVVVTDLSRFHLDILVDEIDIGKLSEGQAVNVTLDAMPEAVISGHIDRISPTPVSSAGITSYKVTVVVDETSAPLRSGLSATASIITDELRDIVLAPNRAIQVDRSSGRAFVEKIVNGIPTNTEVQLGARNELYSQILSGVEPGDDLAIRSGGLDSLRSSMFGGG
ncbi:MAG: HlyD family efflux transporter periplasmic adaptor subunit [Caldilineae bacterium]|nr:HlyD family efflux transporter periplasmic adaptor subunit [Anaerolineae bacterium]MCB9153236.1 HlyD family efflux transporter periplasmic adaptor subunit [Caldilineae bacterium]